MKIMKRRLLIFHPIIAPYRIDFFNRLNKEFETKVCLSWHNLKDQTFDYDKIEAQFDFSPEYLDSKWINLIPKGIFRTLRQFEPDLVLVPECGMIAILVLFYRFLFRKKYRVISMIDDSYNMVVDGNQFSKLHEIAEKLLIPCFDNIINVEPRVADYFQAHYGKGISFPIIVDENKSRKNYETLLSLSEHSVKEYKLEGTKVLLFVGRLVNLKNLQMVIPVFRSLPNNDFRFIIVGMGDYESNLKQMAEGDERIIFTGRLEGNSLYQWYNIANVFVLASYQEPFGAVTNEALLGGCLTLVSNKAGSQCLIEEGKNGYKFSPTSTEYFRDKLLSLLLDAKPIQIPLALRNNQMTVTFESVMANLLNELNK